MAAKNSVKEYIPDAYYHIYNRGVEKRKIFLDIQDYAVLLSYIKTYLLPKDENALLAMLSSNTVSTIDKEKARKLLRLNNFHDSITLFSYCLMPNHFHFLIRQTDADRIDNFMNSLFTRYTMYFNKKYKRVGTLFQGVYKAVRVISQEQLLYLTKYIHRNPLEAKLSQNAQSYSYSSMRAYLNLEDVKWIDSKTIPSMYHFNPKTYQEFIEEQKDIDKMWKTLKDVYIL